MTICFVRMSAFLYWASERVCVLSQVKWMHGLAELENLQLELKRNHSLPQAVTDLCGDAQD